MGLENSFVGDFLKCVANHGPSAHLHTVSDPPIPSNLGTEAAVHSSGVGHIVIILWDSLARVVLVLWTASTSVDHGECNPAQPREDVPRRVWIPPGVHGGGCRTRLSLALLLCRNGVDAVLTQASRGWPHRLGRRAVLPAYPLPCSGGDSPRADPGWETPGVPALRGSKQGPPPQDLL